MSTFSRVLLATDLSPSGDRLTDSLYSLCPDTDTEVVIAHVLEDDEDSDPLGSNYKKIHSRLEGLKNDIEQAGYEEVSITTPKGKVEEVIDEVAEELDADLVMAASHTKNFLERTFMGSTTFELAKATTVPILIAKDDKDNPSRDLLELVMIPTDFSKKSLESLNIIRSMREYVGKVLFVHVIESRKNFRERYNSAKMFLKELVDEMKIFGIEADFRTARGAASKKIVSISEKEHVTLIMMAKTGTEMDNGLDLGSTSENVVQNAACAVMLVPAEDNDDD